MPRHGDRNLTIPAEIYEALAEIAEEDGSLYRSVLELAKEALRIRIVEIRSQNQDWKMKKQSEKKYERKK